jgi:hypothetical protein
MQIKSIFIYCATSAIFTSPLLLAQTQQVTVSASIAQMLVLTVDVASVPFAFTATDYSPTTGIAVKTDLKATTFSVSANSNWKLSVQPGGPAFTFTPSGTQVDPVKSASQLAVRSGTGAYVPLVPAGSLTVITGNRGGTGTTGNSVPVDYQMTSNLATDPPGSYLLTLTYTLASQ